MFRTKSKYLIIGLIIGLSLLSIGTYATTTQSGMIGSLFDRIGGFYKLRGDEIKDNTVDSTEIEDNTIESIDIKDNSLTANDLAPNSVGVSELVDNSITSNKIKDGEVKIQDLANNSVDSSKVKDNSLTANDLAFNSVGNSELQDYLDIKSIQNGWNGSSTKKYGVKIDDTLWVKNNLYVDKNLYINNIKLEEKIKENGTWIKVIDSTISGDGNHNERTKSYTIPQGKGVYSIRLSGRVDDGGVCMVYVYNKIALAITHIGYITKLELSGARSGHAWNKGAGNMKTQEFYIKNLLGQKNLGGQNYGDNYAYNVSGNLLGFLKGGDIIRMNQWYSGGPGGESNHCIMEVKLGDFYY